MSARDLARVFPTATLTTDALDAAGLLAKHQLHSLIALDGVELP